MRAVEALPCEDRSRAASTLSSGPLQAARHRYVGFCNRVLDEHHGIALSVKDFVIKNELEDDGGYTIHPLQLAELA